MATTEEITEYIKAGKTEKSYEITDTQGNFITMLPESQNKEWSEAAKTGHAPIYKNDGGWSSTPEVSVTLNDKTGNIDIKAPKSWMENPSFKATYNSNFLKQLAQAYKADPDTKIPDPDDASKTWSIPDLVAEYDKGLKRYAEEQTIRSDLRQNIRDLTKNDALADGLTEQDFIFMSASGTGENDTDETLISIPQFQGVNLLERAKKLAGYNPDFSQVSRGQFKEVFDVGKASRDDIVQLVVSLSTHLQELANKENPTAEDITEYARTQALVTYLSKNEPEQGFWEETGLFTEASAKGIFSGTATPGGNFLIMLEGAGNILNWITGIPIIKNEDGSSAIGGLKDTPGYSTSIREDIEATRQTEQQELADIAYLNKNAAAVGLMAKIGAEIGTNYFIGKFVGSTVEETATWLADKAIMKSLTNSLSGMANVDKVLTASQSAQALAGVPQAAQAILDVAKTNPSALLSGTNILLNVLHYAGQGEEIAKVVNNAVKAINTTSKFSSYLNLFSQMIIDVATYDASIFRDVIENSDTKEVGELWWTIGSDVALFAGGAALYALANRFPKTKLAQKINTYTAKGMTAVEVAVENTKENLKEVVLGGSNYLSKIKNISKRQVGEANALIRQAKNAVVVAQGLEATEEAIDNLVALQNVVNEGKSNLQGIEAGMINPDVSPVLAPAYNKAVDATQSIINAVNDSGIEIPKLPKDAKGVTIYDKVIPQSVSDYIGAVFQKQQIEADYKKTKKYRPGQETRYNDVIEYTKDFEEKYPTLANQLRETLPTWKQAYVGLDAYNIANHLIDKEELAEKMQSSLFDAGYMKIQTVDEYNDAQDGIVELVIKARSNPTTLSQESYKWGHMTHFKNPMAVLEQAMRQSARVQEARSKLGAMTAQGISPKKTVVSATDYKRAETVSALKGKFKEEVKSAFQGFKEEVSNKGLVQDTINNVMQHSDFLKAQSKAIKSGAKVARAKVANIKITATDRQTYISQINDTDLPNIALEQNGVTFTNILPEEFEIATSIKDNLLFKAGPIRKEIRKAIASNAAFIGWDSSLNSDLRKSDLPKIKTSSYKKLMGIRTLKDADPEIRPFLSENTGTDLEDGLFWSEYMPEFVSAEEGGAFIGTPDDVVQFYKDIIRRETEARSVVKFNYDNFIAACQFDPDLPTRLDRMALSTNTDYIDSEEVREAIATSKRAQQVATAENLWKQDLDKMSGLAAIDEAGRKQLIIDLNDLITEYVEQGVKGNVSSRKTLEALTANEANPKLAQEYIVLSELYDYRKELTGSLRAQISALARNEIQVYNGSVPKEKRLNENALLNTFMDLFDDTLYDRRNAAMHLMQEGGSNLVDERKVYQEINDLNAKIRGAKTDPKMVESINEMGQTEIYEVSPTVADLLKYDPTNIPKTWFQAFMSNKAFELSHRIFRFNITTINAGSFMNQAWRDSLDSYLATGTLMPLNFTEQQIVVNFGDRIAEQYKIKYPELYTQLEQRAQETGQTIQEATVRHASAIGEAYATGTTETAASRLDTSKNAWDKTTNVAEKILEKLEYYAGGFREEYYRKSNYEAALYSALAENKDIDTAVQWALRISRDVTTDFNRMTYHLQAFTSTIPYLRAGVNGTKSFWRLLSLDPVGVGCRLIGGFIIPVMMATISCLQDEENRKYYKTLKEYEKEDQLVFAVNGQFFSIPLPQGIGAFVSPMRHLVESLNDANQHEFWELALNDFFNAIPYNMGAFLDIDGNILTSDPTFMQRVGLEAMSILSTFSPNIVKTIFELTYGVDPYTGKPIDKSYWVIDENGDRHLMDSTQSEFAQWLGQVTGGSASVIATVIEGMFGATSLDLLDSLTALIQYASSEGQAGSLTTLPERIIGGMAGKLTVNEYDRTKSQWNQQLSLLYSKKESLREGYLDYTEKINSASTQEEREKYIAQRTDYISEFTNEVKTMVDNLVNVGGGAIDSYRIAAIVNLLNWYEIPTGQANAYSRYLTDEEKQLAKQEARRTVESLGITTTPGQSMLGYTYRKADGTEEVVFYTPLEILNAQSIYYTSVDIFKVELTTLMEDAGLSSSAKWDGYYKLSTKAERKKYMEGWNKKAVKTIAPYVEKYGVTTIFRNQEISEKLDDYFFTDSYYNAKNYLQEIFGE